ncbi:MULTISPECIES: MATE family efflux transporter [Colwellia]|uniref:Multidrug-efflux transporter n=1 Tax=Colwellia psychrerythraea (strain 34H / ATCC BAA-681) TaxID=167879 RepID=Q480A3_COLP3|nr:MULTISPECIES: MATE family efflux transporter [Colwellia]AAZ26723.1 multidrug resistance protein NorM [Colwellia psychrerythraea 34H]
MNLADFFTHSKSLLKLTYPILIAQLIQNLMGFVDIVMAGRVSATDLAAVAVANSIWLPLILTIYGLIMALSAIVSQLAGAKNYSKIVEQTYQTAWISLVLGLSLILLYYLLIPIVSPLVTLESNLEELMFDYLGFIVWGAPGFCLYLVLRNYSEGLSYTKPTMIISIIGLLVNIPANYIFIYGKFGMPALGGAGCGVATALVYWSMFISMLIYCFYSKVLKQANLFSAFYWPVLAEIKAILGLGIPIALSLLFEVSLFAIVAIILVPFGAQVVASHQVALNFTGLVFMVPLSIAMATTIKVGFAIGNKDFKQARDYTMYSIVLGLALACITALITVLFRTQIAGIYSTEAPVIELAASLMLLATIYQFSDTIQVVSAGALRGYKDTKSILYITFVSYWLVGLSVGLILGVTDWIVPRIGPYGFWIGFIVGLTTAAILLAWRLRIIQERIKNNTFVPEETDTLIHISSGKIDD